MGRIWMSQVVGAIADIGRQYFERPSSRSPITAAKNLCDDLLSERGEASGTALARELVERYDAMAEDDRDKFIMMLAEDYGPEEDKVMEAATDWLRDRSQKSFDALSHAVEAPRQELLRRINIAPEGTATIVKIRERVLELRHEQPALDGLNADLRHLFNSWFNRGFLQFQQIDWRTPANILEKLIAYEAVHEIKGWRDLRRRLADDRRCFAFFHPALPDEPLIFVEVALTDALSGEIGPLIDSDPADAIETPTTAIFYSISNCQAGLAGISFGNLLIKQVVDSLRAELPSIKTFSTLSPIPGFRRWLSDTITNAPPSWLDEDAKTALSAPGFADDAETRQSLEKPLMRLCATYLTSKSGRGLPIDPVGRFHLGNGASVERINFEADLSDKGLKQSAGMMVNYLYDPDKIVANHEAFVGGGEIVMSSRVRSIL